MEAEAQQNIQDNQDAAKKKRAFRIGIIVNEANHDDILYYNEQLRFINKYGNQVSIVVFGYKPEEDKRNIFDGVSFEYVKPVSIVHWFKQIKETEIDLLFIPLINDKYNATSENINKYLEMALMEVPVITVAMYPYIQLIQDKVNGFLYQSREEFIPYLRHLLHKEIGIIKHCGKHAKRNVLAQYNFSPENVEIIESVYAS